MTDVKECEQSKGKQRVKEINDEKVEDRKGESRDSYYLPFS